MSMHGGSPFSSPAITFTKRALAELIKVRARRFGGRTVLAVPRVSYQPSPALLHSAQGSVARKQWWLACCLLLLAG